MPGPPGGRLARLSRERAQPAACDVPDNHPYVVGSVAWACGQTRGCITCMSIMRLLRSRASLCVAGTVSHLASSHASHPCPRADVPCARWRNLAVPFWATGRAWDVHGRAMAAASRIARAQGRTQSTIAWAPPETPPACCCCAQLLVSTHSYVNLLYSFPETQLSSRPRVGHQTSVG